MIVQIIRTGADLEILKGMGLDRKTYSGKINVCLTEGDIWHMNYVIKTKRVAASID